MALNVGTIAVPKWYFFGMLFRGGVFPGCWDVRKAPTMAGVPGDVRLSLQSSIIGDELVEYHPL